jgi:hypothetical protein
MFKKNTSGQFIHFQGVDASTGGIKSGVTWTVRRCIDGTFAAGGGTVTEDGSTGWYKYAMSQDDTNGNNIGFNFTGTGAVPQTVNIITDGAPPDVNTTKVGGISQTARDIGASVLISSGTGAGQLDVTSGVVKANLAQILGTALTETAGQIAAAFKQFFNVGSPTGTVNEVTAIKAKTDSLTFSLAGKVDSNLGAIQSGVDLSDAMKTSVNAEVVDVVSVDTFAEPTGAPAATTTLAGKIGRIYQALRNKMTVSGSAKTFFDDAGSSLWSKSLSDDGTTYTEDEGA